MVSQTPAIPVSKDEQVHAISDMGIGFATVSVTELIDRMRQTLYKATA
jgi:hypothetical protein